ncbi:hypothetical protein HZA98_03580 [Candidatus Woesearchaeota archaeon]|nr:hypothetical protein [Candidatus Woesearchaeota archaeon]
MVKKVLGKSSSSEHDIRSLIASNTELAHKMTDILLGIKELNHNVSSLVTLFKSAGEQIKSGKYEDPMINKINDLLEQNQRLSNALTLVEKYIHEKKSVEESSPLGISKPY